MPSKADIPSVLAARWLWVEAGALPAGSVAGLPPIVPGA